MLRLRLPIAPPLNNAYVNVAGHGRRKSARHRAWIKNADAYYVAQGLQRVEKITVPYVCRMIFPKHRGDIDGRAKLALDWLVSRGLTIDDRHCRDLRLRKTDHPGHDVYIEVEPHAASEHGEPGA